MTATEWNELAKKSYIKYLDSKGLEPTKSNIRRLAEKVKETADKAITKEPETEELNIKGWGKFIKEKVV